MNNIDFQYYHSHKYSVFEVLMQHSLCELLQNDDAPDYFQNIYNTICDEVDFLSITNEIDKERIGIQKTILKRWLPECYGNNDYLTIVGI